MIRLPFQIADVAREAAREADRAGLRQAREEDVRKNAEAAEARLAKTRAAEQYAIQSLAQSNRPLEEQFDISMEPDELAGPYTPLENMRDASPEQIEAWDREAAQFGGDALGGTGGPENPPAGLITSREELDARREQLKRERAGLATQSQLMAQDGTPDQKAADLALAEKAGVSPLAVEVDRQSYQVGETAKRLNAYETTAPRLRRWMDDPQNLSISHDDESLSWWEQIGSGITKLPQAFGAGIGPGTLEYAGGYAQRAVDLVDEFFRSPMPLAFRGSDRSNYTAEELAFIDKEGHLPETPKDPTHILPQASEAAGSVRTYGRDLGKAWTPKTSGDIEAGFVSAGKSMGQLLPWLAGSALARSPGPALMGAEVTTGGTAYGQARDAGKDVFDSAIFSLIQGKIERYTEMLPMYAMFGEVDAGGWITRLAKRFGKSIISDIPGEQIATLTQDAHEQAVLHPDKTWGEYLAERPSAALQTLVASVTQSVFMTGVSEGGAAIGERLDKQQQIADAKNRVNYFKAMGEKTRDSKLWKRMPKKFREMAEVALKDGPRENLSIPADKFVELFQSKEVDPAQFAEAMGVTAQELSEAAATGQDITVKTAAYGETLAGSEYHAELSKHLRFKPTDLTPAEAEAEEKQLDAMFGETVKRFQDAQDGKAELADREATLLSTITEQIKATGTLDPRTGVPPNADVFAAMATTLARMEPNEEGGFGIDPVEYWEKHGPRIRGSVGGEIVEGEGFTLSQVRPRTPQTVDDATVTRASETLGDKQFQAWKLATLQGMGNRDIAVEMGGPEAEMTEAAVQALLSTAGKRGFPVESTAPEGAGRNRSDATQTLIAMKAEGKSHAEVAAAVYPDREPAKAVNQVRQLTHRFKAEIAAKRGELVLAQEASDLDPMGFYSAAQRSAEQIPDNIWKMGWQAARNALVKGRGGVAPKRTEIEFLGLDAMFGETKLKGADLKAAVLEHIAATRLILVEDFARFDPNSRRTPTKAEMLEELGSSRLEELLDLKWTSIGTADRKELVADTIIGRIEGLHIREERSFGRYSLVRGYASNEEIIATGSRPEMTTRFVRIMFETHKGKIAKKVSREDVATHWQETKESNLVRGPGDVRLPGEDVPLFESVIGLPAGVPGSDYRAPRSHVGGKADGTLVTAHGEERVDDKGQRTLFTGQLQSDMAQQAREQKEVDRQNAAVIEAAGINDRQAALDFMFSLSMGYPRETWDAEVGSAFEFVSDNRVIDQARGKWALRNNAVYVGNGYTADALSTEAPLLSTSEWTNVGVRAMVYRAARDGFASVSFPTGETSAIIQGNDDAANHYDTNVKGALERIAKQLGGEVRGGAVTYNALEQSEWENLPPETAEIVLQSLWSRLPPAVRGRVRMNMPNMRKSEDGEFYVASSSRPGNDDSGVGKDTYEWTFAREAKRNPLLAAYQIWVQGAMVFGEPGAFERLIVAAGGSPGSISTALQEAIALGEPAPAYVLDITPEMRAKIVAEGFPLFQSGDKNRGTYRSAPGQRSVIDLFEARDLSTLMHEAAHWYLDTLLQMEQSATPHPLVTEQLDAIYKWHGTARDTPLFTATGAITPAGVEIQEAFAETFIAYLKTGKAPSAGLRKAFAAFASWLTRLYEDVKFRLGQSRENLTPEISEVFDRMLASREEIAAARAEIETDANALADAMGLTPAQKARVGARLQDAKEQAEAEMTADLVSSYFQNQKTWWQDEYRKERDQVVREIDQRPEQRALAILSGKGYMGEIGQDPDQPFGDSGYLLTQAWDLGYTGTDTGEAVEWLSAHAAGLKMDREDRYARAQMLGFDTGRTFYRGSDTWDGVLRVAPDGSYGPGVSLADDPDIAGEFAEGEDANVAPVFVRGELKEVDETVGERLTDPRRAPAVIAELRAAGFSGVIDPSNGFVNVFDPVNIRSVNAAFDPEHKDEANLLAQRDTVLDFARYYEPDATNDNLEALWWRMAKDGVPPVIRLFKLPDGRVMAFDGATYTHDDARDLLNLGNLKLKHGMFQRGTKLAVTNWYGETGSDLVENSLSQLKAPNSFKVMRELPDGDLFRWYAESVDEKTLPQGTVLLSISSVDGGVQDIEIEMIPTADGGLSVDMRLDGEQVNPAEPTLADAARANAVFIRSVMALRAYIKVNKPEWMSFTGATEAHDKLYAFMLQRFDLAGYEARIATYNSASFAARLGTEDYQSSSPMTSFRTFYLVRPDIVPTFNRAPLQEQGNVQELQTATHSLLTKRLNRTFVLRPAQMESSVSQGGGTDGRRAGSGGPGAGGNSLAQIGAKNWGPVSPPPSIPPMRLDLQAVREAHGEEAVQKLPPSVRRHSAASDSVEGMLEQVRLTKAGLDLKQPKSLTSLLRSTRKVGPIKYRGIADPDGELANIFDAGKVGIIANPKNDSKQARSMTIEQAAMWAWEERYFTGINPPDINEFLDAIREDQTRPLYRPEDQAVIDQIANAEVYADWFDQGGVDINEENPAKLRAAVEVFISAKGENVVAPDQAADLFDRALGSSFKTGEGLLAGLTLAQSRDRQIRAETDKRMAAKHGDPFNDGTIAEKARIHARNEVHARQTEIQLEALATAVGSRAAGSAARDMAQRQLAAMTVKQVLDYRVFLTYERRWTKAALEAAASGDKRGAMLNKQRAFVNQMLYTEGAKLAEKIESTRKHMLSFDSKPKRVRLHKAGKDYADQMDALLEGYEFRKRAPGELKQRQALAAWFAEKQAAMDPLKNEKGLTPEEAMANEQEALDRSAGLAALQEDANLRNYTQLTMQELDGVRAQADAIWAMARLKDKILTEQERESLQLAALDGAASIVANHPKKQKPEPYASLSPKVANKRGQKEYWLELRTLQSLIREIDGGQDGGWGATYILRVLNEAWAARTSRMHQAQKDVAKLFKDAYGADVSKLRKGVMAFPGVDQPMALMERLAIAANWGTEINRKRVMDGEGWSRETVEGILASLDQRDWKFVQSLWDYAGSFYDEANAVHEQVHGVPMSKQPGVPIVTRFGTIEGNYWPLIYDSSRSSKTAQRALEADAKVVAGRVGARQQAGFTKERVKGRVQLPILMDVSAVLTRHLDDVIGTITTQKAMLDVGRLVMRKEIEEAIVERYGRVVYQQIVNTLRETRNGADRARGATERNLTRLRNGATIVGLGLSIKTALLQPLGHTNSLVRLGGKNLGWVGGVRWLATGFYRLGTGAKSHEAALKFIVERSEYMKNRRMSQNRELADIRNRVDAGEIRGGVRNFIDQASMFMIVNMQYFAVDAPLWLAAYEKALHYGADDAKAVSIADQTVIDAQGGGELYQLAGLQRGSPLLKLFTNFLSYAVTTWNLGVSRTAATNFKNPGQAAAWAMDMFMIMSVPAIMMVLLETALASGGDDDAEDEEFVEKYAREQLSFMLSQLGLFGQLGGAVSGYGYSGPQGTRALSDASKAVAAAGKDIQRLRDGEQMTGDLIRPLNLALGAWYHFPAGALDRAVRGGIAIAKGEITDPVEQAKALAFGPPRK